VVSLVALLSVEQRLGVVVPLTINLYSREKKPPAGLTGGFIVGAPRMFVSLAILGSLFFILT